MSTLTAIASLRGLLIHQLGPSFVNQALGGLSPQSSNMVLREMAFAASVMTMKGMNADEIRNWLIEPTPISPLERMHSGRLDHADVWREELDTMLKLRPVA